MVLLVVQIFSFVNKRDRVIFVLCVVVVVLVLVVMVAVAHFITS